MGRKMYLVTEKSLLNHSNTRSMVYILVIFVCLFGARNADFKCSTKMSAQWKAYNLLSDRTWFGQVIPFSLVCMYQKDWHHEVKLMLKMLRISVTIAIALLVIESGWQLEQSSSCWSSALVSYTTVFQVFIFKFQYGTGILFANVHYLIAVSGKFINLVQAQEVFLLKNTEVEHV